MTRRLLHLGYPQARSTSSPASRPSHQRHQQEDDRQSAAGGDFTPKETSIGIGIRKGETALKKELARRWVKTNFENKVLRDVYRRATKLPDDLTSASIRAIALGPG